MRITEEEMREYGLDKHPDVDFMSADTHPEEMRQIMNCLADKFLARSAILKAELQARGEWKEEYEQPDYEVGDEEMSIFEYEERYGGDEDDEDAGDKK